jgi:hypothetical protein
MKKDIFIDNNIASKFSNPQDKEYIKLTKWLLTFDASNIENKDDYAHLVVSKKLLVEHIRSNQNAQGSASIPMIIAQLQKEGRLIIIKNDEIKNFKRAYYTKTVTKHLKSNHEDREHIPLVLLSDRKFALSNDVNFIHDLKNCKGFTVTIESRPEKLPYAQ